jgi:ATP-binding protein involved in chromosome partitioning
LSISADTPTVLSTSGKGGVGKTLVTAGLVLALARAGVRTGALDIDVRSPNLDVVMGVRGHHGVDAAYRALPAWAGNDGQRVPVMSSAFRVPEGLGMTLSGEQMRRVIRDMLGDTVWPDVDVLVADVDPGPGDSIDEIRLRMRHLFAVVTSTSDASSLGDCSRMIDACEGHGIRVLGVVANMVGIVCGDCGAPVACTGCGAVPRFGEADPVRNLARARGVPYLGDLPLSPMYRDDPVRAVTTIGRVLFDGLARRVVEAVGR